MVRRLIVGMLVAGAILVLAVGGFVVYAVQTLPSIESLASYRPPVTTRVHAGDGSLIAEFAEQQRVFVPIEDIPERLKQAFLSAEDKTFYEHGGIDPWGLLRGAVLNPLTGKRQTGGSTITQQVAKNMLLSSDRKLVRKIREAFLAKRIEQAFDKDQILELYMNEVWLGERSYGVAAASLNYFNKPLAELTVGECAYLAALLKGPDNYHPVRRKQRAIERRNWVIGQMAKNGFITDAEASAAMKEDLVSQDRLSGERYLAADYYVEEVRRRALGIVGGEKKLNEGGLSIRSTLNSDLQLVASQTLRQGIESYDRRHGWRGPVETIPLEGDIAAALGKVKRAPPITGWQRAVVTKVDSKGVAVRTIPGEERLLLSEDVKWAAAGAKSKKERALKPGAVVYVAEAPKERFALKQIPEVSGAMLAMDPHTGRVLAMVGGYSFAESKFNRATQAKRQPGSTFKPIVYAAALDNGFTPSSIIEDAPLEGFIAGDGKAYSPENYTKEFYGPRPLRFGLEKSLNLMTIRVGLQLGPDKVLEYGHRLGVYPDDHSLAVPAIALGAQVTTLAQLVSAYSMFVNGGKWVQPQLIDRVQDRDGKTVYRGEAGADCPGCTSAWNGQAPPQIADTREQVLDPITAYQIVSMLEGVVQRGTGSAVKAVGKPLAGKTGTTDDYKDAWFVGFSPDLTVGVWIGFDTPKSLGNGETGGTMAAPIFRDFMKVALANTPEAPFRIPPGVRLVRVDATTGQLPRLDSTELILEAFKPGTEPTSDAMPSPLSFGAESGEGINLQDLAALFPGQEVEGADTAQPTPPGGPSNLDPIH